MEKKKWSNPELNQEEVINTHSEDCECGKVATKGTKHYCHHNPSHNHAGNHTNDSNPKPNDHFMSVNCPEHGNTCCCYVAGQSS